MARAMVALTSSDDERETPGRPARRGTVAQRTGLGAKIVLACAAGAGNRAAAAELRVTARTAGKWRQRSVDHRLDGRLDEPRCGTPRTVTDEQAEDVVVRTPESTPKGRAHRGTRQMAAAAGLGRSVDHRPHLAGVRAQAAPDRDLRVVAGPAVRGEGPRRRRAVHEPACERRRRVCRREEPDPGLGPDPAPVPGSGRAADQRLRPPRDDEPVRRPERRDRRGRRAAAPPPPLGGVPHVPRRGRRRRARGARRARLATDSYGTHKTPPIRDWLAKRPRFHVHFTPTCSSWLNLVERLFAEPTGRVRPPRVAPEHRGVGGGDPGVPGGPAGQAVRVDQDGRRDPGQHQAVRHPNLKQPLRRSSTNFGARTLGRPPYMFDGEGRPEMRLPMVLCWTTGSAVATPAVRRLRIGRRMAHGT